MATFTSHAEAGLLIQMADAKAHYLLCLVVQDVGQLSWARDLEISHSSNACGVTHVQKTLNIALGHLRQYWGI